MIFIVLIWIACAFICGTMASSRNRSPLGWGIAGLFFGVFAILLLALVGHQYVPDHRDRGDSA
ncbi:MAG: hypothetical protein EP335_05745 [Alphaproteobacteria bacterium]|nr:MAG: hypothetical protein EP335_05745 [Alphaproteobacteria bacterium]